MSGTLAACKPAAKEEPLHLDAHRIAAGMAALAAADPRFASAASRHGVPAPRIRAPGYATLLRTIVSQQLSTRAASSIWRKLEAAIGQPDDPLQLLNALPEDLRAAGLSQRKVDYARSLAALVADGGLPLDRLPDDDDEAIALISSVKGLGRWSAEIYLLFAEGRADVFPAGDLALQVQAGRLFADGERLAEQPLRDLAQGWRPHRGVAAIFLWHCYNAPPL